MRGRSRVTLVLMLAGVAGLGWLGPPPARPVPPPSLVVARQPLPIDLVRWREGMWDGVAEPARKNLPPIAINDLVRTDENRVLVFDPLVNDGDPDGEHKELRIQYCQPESDHGRVRWVPGGQLAYWPNPGFHGTDTFTYTVADGWGAKATAQVQVIVAPVNDPCRAFHDAYTYRLPALDGPPPTYAVSAADGALSNDSDDDGDRVTVLPGSVDATHFRGRVEVAADGSFTFTPDVGAVGRMSFTYRATDGNGSTSDPATVYVWVLPPAGLELPADRRGPFEVVSPTIPVGDDPVVARVTKDCPGFIPGRDVVVLSSHPHSGRITRFDPDGTFRLEPNPVKREDTHFTWTIIREDGYSPDPKKWAGESSGRNGRTE